MQQPHQLKSDTNKTH